MPTGALTPVGMVIRLLTHDQRKETEDEPGHGHLARWRLPAAARRSQQAERKTTGASIITRVSLATVPKSPAWRAVLEGGGDHLRDLVDRGAGPEAKGMRPRMQRGASSG